MTSLDVPLPLSTFSPPPALPAMSSPADPLLRPFPSPFVLSGGADPRTLVEQSMLRLSASLRALPDWRTQRLDSSTADQWSSDALSADPLLTPAAVAYVLAEIAWYDQTMDEQSGVERSLVDGVWQSSRLLPADLVAPLKAQVQAAWGGQSDDEKDWHPGSGRQVWDVVHPVAVLPGQRPHAGGGRAVLAGRRAVSAGRWDASDVEGLQPVDLPPEGRSGFQPPLHI